MIRAAHIPSLAELKELLQPLFSDAGLRLALVFGSTAEGTARRGSDIDVAFRYDAPVDALELTNRVIRLLRTDNVDVVDLRCASPLLKFAAARQGRVLYERDPGEFAAFSSLAFRRYVDTKKLRTAKAESIRRYLASRGLQ